MYLSSSGGNLSSYAASKTLIMPHPVQAFSSLKAGEPAGARVLSLISLNQLSSLFLLSFCIPFSPTPDLCKQ